MPSSFVFITLAVLATSCAPCAPGTVGPGVARLTIRNVGAMVTLVNAVTNCGFASQAVLGSPTVTGSVGSQGSLTFTVTDCAIGLLPAGTTVSTNGLGTQTKAGGTVTASGTKTVTGLRNANPPIIPTGVTTPATSLTLTGTGSVRMKPVGGESSTSAGVYSITTPVAAVEALTLASGSVILKSDGSTFELALTNVALEAFTGAYLTNSNKVSGSLTVDGQPVSIAAATPLAPAFAQATYDSTYVCTPGLKEVIPFP